MRRRRWSAFLVGVGVVWTASPPLGAAAPLDPRAVPAPLQPWVPWVLRGHESDTCPVASAEDGADPVCAWSGRLALVLDARGGRFIQEWEVLAPDTKVPLPGDERRWPLDVKAGGKPVAVIDDEGVPSVQLPPGRHALSGTFQWGSLPESLPVPPQTGLVALTVEGKRLDFPSRDDDGGVFLQKVAAPAESDSLQVSVHRKIDDGVPLLLTTRVTLEVAGKPRELLLGKGLPAGFAAHTLESPLPARLEPDGRLRLQVRPGTWVITLVGRHGSPVTKLTRPVPGGPWKEGEEVWVFQAMPHLRAATVEGVPAVDPQQTTLPAEWRTLPAYVMAPGATLTLAEQRRGDASPAPDQLTLTRSLWLDFDGGGLTTQDRIRGTFTKSWRLAMGPSEKLGRVAVGGADQFITRFGPEGREGIELRQGSADISAESRITGVPRSFPATGWDHDFKSVSATLQLPPGWRLIHATGADDVSESWLQGWTLLQLFLVLICAVATAKLFGPRAGVLMLLGLGLTVTEPDAPEWLWLAVLVGEALARALGETRAGPVLRLYRAGAWLVLVLVAVPFAVGHLRVGLFPAQDDPGTARVMRFSTPVASVAPMAPPPRPAPAAAREESVEGEKDQLADVLGSAVGEESGVGIGGLRGISGGSTGSVGAIGSSTSRMKAKTSVPGRATGLYGLSPPQQNLTTYDPSVVVQTGPGVPRWSWRQVGFTWNGPVERGQRLRLWLVSPGFNTVLAFVRVGLLAALLLLFVRRGRGIFRGPFWPGRAAAAGAGLLAALAGTPAHAAEFPPEVLLEQLRVGLLEDPECAPSCATVGRMTLEATGDRLRLRFEASAAATTAIPLPGHGKHWVPSEVALDGKPSAALTRDEAGTLWLRLSPGSHQVLLDGPLPAREVVQIPMRLKPHAISTSVRGWKLHGLGEDGEIADTLQLTREEREAAAGAGASSGLGASSLPPFVTVERKLQLGLKWQVETTVTRTTPAGSAVLLEVPLLPGESPLTEGLRIAGGKVQLTMAPEARETSWRSTLDQRPALALVAGPGTSLTEIWSLETSPIWHVDVTGIPPILQPAAASRVPRWQPWPGEQVTLAITRPTGTEGQTLTIESASLELRPGARSTQGTLHLLINASRGGQHVMGLPAGATLESLDVDGVAQPLRADGGRVTVPIQPKRQRVGVVYRAPTGLGLLFRTPVPDLGAPAVNLDVEVHLPSDRWVLMTGGPRLGPSVLFWSSLVVIVLVALGLGRTSLAPLRTRQWLLLGLGLAQAPVAVQAIVAGWFLAMGLRARQPELRPWLFDLRQAVLVVWTMVTAAILFICVREGLLSTPDMHVAGNASGPEHLRWFSDRTGAVPPTSWVLSAPLLAYRIAMLAWALWLALAVIRWSKWFWRAFSEGGSWRRLRAPRPEATPTQG
jgi:hypothetical protein